MNLIQFSMLGVFVVLILGLVLKRVGAIKAFSGAALATYLMGFVSTDELMAKSSSSVVVVLVLMMLVSIGLERFGWISRFSNRLIGAGYAVSVFRLGMATALTSAFLNNTAVVAALMHSVRTNPHHPASSLLIPLSYAAIFGGTMTLVGTSTNLIVAALYADATGNALALFDFFPIGLSLTLLGLFTVIAFSRFLPRHAQHRVEIQEYLLEADVSPESPLVGRSISANGLRELEGLFLVEIVRGGHVISPVAPSEFLEAGDKLIFSGDVKRVDVLNALPGIHLYAVREGLLRENMVESIVLPNAVIEGKTLKEAGFRALFDAAVVGIRRGGRRLSGQLGNISIRAGDSLILAVGSDFYSRQNLAKNFAILNERHIKKQLRGWQELACGGAFIVSVIAASLGLVPLVKGLILTLTLMLMVGAVKPAEIRRRFPFELWLIISAALVLSQGMINTGLSDYISSVMWELFCNYSPMVALVAIYVLTLVLTELVTNTAAAALVFPLACAVAQTHGIDPLPFCMAVAYGASGSFLTPYGYATNLMVQNVGAYGLGDYVKAGLPVSLIYSLAVLLLLPVVFPL